MKTPNRRQKKKTRKYKTPNKFPTKLGETSLSSSATIGKKGKKKLEQWTGAIQLREMTDKRRARFQNGAVVESDTWTRIEREMMRVALLALVSEMVEMETIESLGGVSSEMIRRLFLFSFITSYTGVCASRISL